MKIFPRTFLRLLLFTVFTSKSYGVDVDSLVGKYDLKLAIPGSQFAAELTIFPGNEYQFTVTNPVYRAPDCKGNFDFFGSNFYGKARCRDLGVALITQTIKFKDITETDLKKGTFVYISMNLERGSYEKDVKYFIKRKKISDY